MKKILTLALCIAAVGSMGAQKANVDQAKKLASKDINGARELIKQAMANPETANNVETFMVAGNMEYGLYDKDKLKMSTGATDINQTEMDKALLQGYKYMMAALPLDSLPNAKGEVKPKNSKKIINEINNHYDDYYRAGANFFNNKMYYPEAYEAFMIHGELPSWEHASKNVMLLPDTTRAVSYFNAGLCAYSGNALPESVKALRQARLHGYTNPESYVYEIACWQNIMNNDSTQIETAKRNIDEIARAGYKAFGMQQPIFINNIVNTLVTDNKGQEALDMVTETIEANPDVASLYGLRGFVNDRLGNDDASIENYRKAVKMANVDYETLKNASKKIFKVGTALLNQLEGTAPETLQKRKELRDNYFQAAHDIAMKARGMKPNDSDLDYVLDSIDYALETYFTGIQ